MDWEGDFPGGQNPLSITLDPTRDLPGLRTLTGLFQSLPDGVYELVYSPATPYRSILGDERRYQGQAGTEVQITLPDPASSGFDFVGWDGTVTGDDIVSLPNQTPLDWEKSLSIRVRLTRSMRLIPIVVPRPCIGPGLQAFTETIHVSNAKGVAADLQFGMQPGAGDGLETGQPELPPIPPPGVPDFRFINIPGVEGSFFDIRDMKPSFTFLGRAQPGDQGDPLMMQWDPIPSSMPGSFLLNIAGRKIDMRTQTRLQLQSGGPLTFTIGVSQDSCRQLPNGTIRITSSSIDSTSFPLVRGTLCLEDTQGDPLFNLRRSDIAVHRNQSFDEPDAFL